MNTPDNMYLLRGKPIEGQAASYLEGYLQDSPSDEWYSETESSLNRLKETLDWLNSLSDNDYQLIETDVPRIREFVFNGGYRLDDFQRILKDEQERDKKRKERQALIERYTINLPPLNQVKERMRRVFPTKESLQAALPRWELPQELSDVATTFDERANNSATQQYPIHWELRPERGLTQQLLIQQIADLPREPSGHEDKPFPKISVRGENHPFKSYYLSASHKEILVVNGKIIGKEQGDWTYRDRTIKYLGHHSYNIESSHHSFTWTFNDRRWGGNPTLEYEVLGGLRVTDDDSRYDKPYQGYTRYPNTPHHDPNSQMYDRLDSLSFYIYSSSVYGQAWIGLKELGFFGGLDVAINWIEMMEWAYDVAAMPKWLDGATDTYALPAETQSQSAPVIQVSEETQSWVKSRAKRYGKSGTGKHWKEIDEAIRQSTEE